MERAKDVVKIKDRPPELQPRERLMSESAQVLSSEELLAILLRTGTRKQDVLELSREVLVRAGGLEGMLTQNMHSLCEINGIGPTKACTLLAAIEIGRRLARASRAKEKEPIREAKDAADYLRTVIRSPEQEAFAVLYLNAKNIVIDARTLFIGTVNGANVHPRDIFREAVRHNAVSLIVGHNHPSGDVRPSREDVLLTKRLQEAAEIIGVNFLDHIILGTTSDREYLSFKENGYME